MMANFDPDRKDSSRIQLNQDSRSSDEEKANLLLALSSVRGAFSHHRVPSLQPSLPFPTTPAVNSDDVNLGRTTLHPIPSRNQHGLSYEFLLSEIRRMGAFRPGHFAGIDLTAAVLEAAAATPAPSTAVESGDVPSLLRQQLLLEEQRRFDLFAQAELIRRANEATVTTRTTGTRAQDDSIVTTTGLKSLDWHSQKLALSTAANNKRLVEDLEDMKMQPQQKKLKSFDPNNYVCGAEEDGMNFGLRPRLGDAYAGRKGFPGPPVQGTAIQPAVPSLATFRETWDRLRSRRRSMNFARQDGDTTLKTTSNNRFVNEFFARSVGKVSCDRLMGKLIALADATVDGSPR